LEGFFKSIDMPTHLSEVGITADAIDELTEDVIRMSLNSRGRLNSRVRIGRKDIGNIYRLAL
jgi:alcohol dehydrogenase YqhD (iron-dependent ADH family)